MITLGARINLIDSGKVANIMPLNLAGNNVSATPQSLVGKRNISVGNPFILGRSKLGSGFTYVKKLPYFLGNRLSDTNGKFPITYSLSIQGNNIASATIVFDKEHNGHPNSIVVDAATTYVDDDAQYEIIFENPATFHNFRINNWNKPYSPLIITSIYADINIEIDRNNLLSFSSNIFDRATLDEPSYGIISNSANLDVSDLDEQILDLITQQILHSGITTEVWINNPDGDVGLKQEKICLMETRELFYDTDNRTVQVSLKDNLEEWQQIEIEGINYYNEDGTAKEPQTAKWYYEYLYSKTPSKYNMLLVSYLDSDTIDILENTIIEYPVLESGKLWDSWQKLCELCLLHIYVNKEGKTVCVYNKGN